MERQVYRMMLRERNCDYGIVVDVGTHKVISTRAVKGSLKKEELSDLWDNFENEKKALEHGFELGGKKYCVTHHRGDELFAREKLVEEVQSSGVTCPGVVCLRTKSMLVISHFPEAPDMSQCVVLIGKIKESVSEYEENTDSIEKMDTSKIIETPHVPPRRKKNNIKKKKVNMVLKPDDNEQEIGKKIFSMLLENEHSDQNLVFDRKSRKIIFSSSKTTTTDVKEEEELLELFDNQVKAYKFGFKLCGTVYCVNRHLGNEIWGRSKKKTQQEGIICLRTRSHLIITHFNSTFELSPCVVHIGKIRDALLKREKEKIISSSLPSSSSTIIRTPPKRPKRPCPSSKKTTSVVVPPPMLPLPGMIFNNNKKKKKIEDGVPKTIHDITKEYLEEKLNFGPIEEFSFSDLKVEGFQSVIKRIHIVYKEEEEESEGEEEEKKKKKKKPKTVILKMTGRNVLLKCARIFHTTEFHMFELLEKLNLPIFTKIYYKEIDKWWNFIFLMEDLSSEENNGVVKKVIDMNDAKLVIRTLASLQKPFWNKATHHKDYKHPLITFPIADDFMWYGLFYCNGRKLEDTFFTPQNERKINEEFKKCFESVKEMEDEEDMNFLKKIDIISLFREHLKKCHDPSTPKVLVHGDFRGDNMMFLKSQNNNNNEEEIRFIDWQLSRIGSPCTDIVSFINGVDFASEEFDLDVLMKYYYFECLGEDIRKDFSFELLMEEFKNIVVVSSLFFLRTYQKGHVEIIKQMDQNLYKLFIRSKRNCIKFLKRFF